MNDDQWMESPPEGVEGWRRVWRENLRYRVIEPASLLRRRTQALVRRLVQSVSREEAERQRNFNLAAIEMFDDTRHDLESLHNDILTITRDLGVELQKFQQLLPVAVQRSDALLAALDQKIETIAVRIKDMTTPVLTDADASPGLRNDILYRRLEDGLRGSAGQVRTRMQPYLEYARRSAPVVDVGCGRGEFLELCREAGIAARGFDTNERSVATLRERGFEVELRGIPGCFAELGQASIGSIVATHVVEHLPVAALFELFAGAARALRTGGYFMIETPNAESLSVSGSEFWRDPTHLAPRHVAALTLLAREFGFEVEELRTANEFPPGRRLRVRDEGPVRELADQLNAVLYGDQDLRLILRKA